MKITAEPSTEQPQGLVIFGASNILSDLFDCALANGLLLSKVVLHHPETLGERDRPLNSRIAALHGHCPLPRILQFDEFIPEAHELYLLGPTTPSRTQLVEALAQRFQPALPYHTLIHPSAYVSPLAQLGPGVFVGANSVIGPGVVLGAHVFVNRGVTIGHDTQIGAFSRIQPGANLGGLTQIGDGVTIAMGATVLERLQIGDHALIAAGAVVTKDVAENTLVAGVPATFKKSLI